MTSSVFVLILFLILYRAALLLVSSQKCGKEISQERLQANPAAEFDIECGAAE